MTQGRIGWSGLGMLVWLSAAGQGADAWEHADAPLRAGLLHLRQTGPSSDVVVFGADGSCRKGDEIIAIYADQSFEAIGTCVERGRFRVRLEWQKAADGLSLASRLEDHQSSEPVRIPLDWPRQGGMSKPPNERGFINMVSANYQIDYELGQWLKATHGLGKPDSPAINMERLRPVSLERAGSDVDIVVYGYNAEGDSATCVNGPTGYSQSAPLVEGVFRLRLERERLAAASTEKWAPVSLACSITRDNQIVAMTGWNPTVFKRPDPE